jgi:hypothetical protein
VSTMLEEQAKPYETKLNPMAGVFTMLEEQARCFQVLSLVLSRHPCLALLYLRLVPHPRLHGRLRARTAHGGRPSAPSSLCPPSSPSHTCVCLSVCVVCHMAGSDSGEYPKDCCWFGGIGGLPGPPRHLLRPPSPPLPGPPETRLSLPLSLALSLVCESGSLAFRPRFHPLISPPLPAPSLLVCLNPRCSVPVCVGCVCLWLVEHVLRGWPAFEEANGGGGSARVQDGQAQCQRIHQPAPPVCPPGTHPAHTHKLTLTHSLSHSHTLSLSHGRVYGREDE